MDIRFGARIRGLLAARHTPLGGLKVALGVLAFGIEGEHRVRPIAYRDPVVAADGFVSLVEPCIDLPLDALGGSGYTPGGGR